MKVSKMHPWLRRVLQVALFEGIAIVLVTIGVLVLSNDNFLGSLSYAVITSAIAVVWNYVYNTGFEYWESQQVTKGRSILRRIAHAFGFELGFVVIFVPFMAWWFSISLLMSFLAEISLMLFFLFYSLSFNWAFDKIVGLPKSAAPINEEATA